jgi:hypothetical protein
VPITIRPEGGRHVPRAGGRLFTPLSATVPDFWRVVRYLLRASNATHAEVASGFFKKLYEEGKSSSLLRLPSSTTIPTQADHFWPTRCDRHPPQLR